MEGPPPSRGIASAGSGQNSPFSEIISMVVEPIVNAAKGGLEKISSADVLSQVDELNLNLAKLSQGKSAETTSEKSAESAAPAEFNVNTSASNSPSLIDSDNEERSDNEDADLCHVVESEDLGPDQIRERNYKTKSNT